MTVAQLIRKLQKMPQDAIVTMSNNDCYINGEYTVDFVEPYGDGTVEICTDYEKNLTYEDILENLTKKVR